jgi:hypothetical protein
MQANTAQRTARGRLPTILVATLFNLLFEFSLRGLQTILARPFLSLLLFVAYFSFFTMLEDLIVRFRLRDFNVAIAAFFFGTIYVALVSGAAFTPPRFAGLNWGAVLYITLAWWAVLQSVFTFYVANRVAPRDWNHRLLPRLGWIALIAVNVLIIGIFQANRQTPPGDTPGFLAILLLLLASAGAFVRLLARAQRQDAAPEFRRDRLLDLLALVTVGVFVVGALTNRNQTLEAAATDNPTGRLVLIWTLVLAIVVVIYRLLSRRPIPV